MIDLVVKTGDYHRRYKPINLMKKLSYLFAVLLVAGALIARPAHAETSYADISVLLKSLIAQVQELQRQLAIMQKEEGLVATKPVIKYVQAKAAEEGEIYAGETAYIYGTGLYGDLTIKLGNQEPKYVKGKGSSDSYAEFTVPEWAGNASVAFKVTNSSGSESDPGYNVDIIVPGDTDEDEMFKIATPNKGSLKAGDKYEITWKSMDLLPDDEVELYWTSECKNVGGGRIANTANDDSYTWLVPEKLVSDKCGYKVGIRWSSQPFPYPISDERYDESDEWLWVTDR